MLIFGGNATSSVLNDTWGLGLSGTPSWTQIIAGNAPPPRQDATVAYDATRRALIVFAGRALALDSWRDDAWMLGLDSNVWSEFRPAGAAPGGRSGAAGVFDPVRERLMVFGGESLEGLRGDVTALSLSGGAAWCAQLPAGASPTARRWSSLVYDGIADRMFLFGGTDSNHDLSDLFELSPAGGLAIDGVVDPPGTGTFTVLPPDRCHAAGEPVTLRATPAPGYRFLKWDGLGSSQNPLTLTPAGHVATVARFAPIATSVEVAMSGRGIDAVIPNPTSGALSVQWSLAREGAVKLVVLDVAGREVARLESGVQAAGRHSTTWNAHGGTRRAPKGIYFVRFTAEGVDTYRRVALID